MESKNGSPVDVLLVFLRLGCTSFGGPVAHLGYFRKELVERRRWCTEQTLAELIGLAQSLPGPASSQVGFALGLLRAGWLGGLAAWVGFTLPSAALMVTFAYGQSLPPTHTGAALLHGLQLAAVAVVAQAVLSMQRSLAPDTVRIALAVTAACITLVVPAHYATLLVISIGAAAGLLLYRNQPVAPVEDIRILLSRRAALICAAAFVLLFTVALVPSSAAQIFANFYRSGALVFGGGHVVLPMLEDAVVTRGWVTQPAFLAGYGATQALPGPLFTFAAYLGAMVDTHGLPKWLGGLCGLLGIFAPGLLLMAAVLPFWGRLRRLSGVAATLRGVNAAVVGILLAALYRPLLTTTIHRPSDILIALAGFSLLVILKQPPWVAVFVTVAASYITALR